MPSRKYNIVYASLCKPSSREANAIQIDRMCTALLSAGHQVTLTAIGKRPDKAKNYNMVPVPWSYTRLKARIMQTVTRLTLRSLRPDILFTRTPLLAIPGLNNGARIVLELHSLPQRGSKSFAALRTLMRHHNLRRVVTISQALADDLISEYGPPHFGCDVVVAHDGAEAGPSPGVSRGRSGPLRVGYFGHLYPGKGMETIAKLAPMTPDLYFEVYGGNEGDISRWREACSSIKNIKLHGHILHEDVGARMADCDILIAPYSSQVQHSGKGDIGRWMSPLKLFEYMAAARPMLVSDLPVVREVLQDGKSALMCTPDDVESFAKALRLLAADPDLRGRLGRAARRKLEEEYTWDIRARRVLQGIEVAGVG